MKYLSVQIWTMKFKNIGVYHMKFKDLEWKDVVSDNMIVSSHCMINLCGVIKMERIKKAIDYLVVT